MNTMKLVFLLVVISSIGCSLIFSSPSSVVKDLISEGERGNVDAMVALWGSKAIAEQGADKIRSNAERFAKLQQNARAAGENPGVEKLRETINGDRARVFFLYRDSKGTDSVAMGFALLKENGKWKLYRSIDTSDEEKPFESSFGGGAPTKPAATPEPVIDAATPLPPSPENPNSGSTGPTHSAGTSPISGGMLNDRAVSLPSPVYPPAARAVKASGTVMVQVTVDETGHVVSATAVSGHPLLRGAAVAAARSARFKPTMLSGKPVKVSGVIKYEFSAQ